MPYSVQLPNEPAIVKHLPTETSVTPQCRDVVCHVSTQVLPVSAIASPTPPETFAPEPSPWKAAKSAALLKPPVSSESTSIRGGEGERGREGEGERGRKINNDYVNGSAITTKEGNVVGKWVNNQKFSPPTRLLTQDRGGKVKEFNLRPASAEEQPLQKQDNIPPSTIPPQTGQPQSPPAPQQEPLPVTPPTPTPPIPPASQPQPEPVRDEKTPPVKPAEPSGGISGVVELTSDRQEYDVDRQIVTAEGNVIVRFQNGVLDADRLQISLPNRLMVAQGNVALRRGEQLLRGDRLEYYFVQDTGFVLNASGEIYQPRAGTDLAPVLASDTGSAVVLTRPLSDRITADQPQQQVTSAGGYVFVVGAGRDFQNLPQQRGGTVNRFRFQAERVDFDSVGFRANKIRITNDPFSPPELELRADTARFRRIEPLVSEITTTNSRLVLDQGFALPIFQNRRVIDRRPRDPALLSLGIDGTDRDGLYGQINLTPINTPSVQLRVLPQFFIQRAFQRGKFFDPSAFGLKSTLYASLGPRTSLVGLAEFFTVDPTDLENKTRGSLRLRQIIGRTLPHTLSVEYSYRDRLFNGSLGFQTVQSSLGAVITSPVIVLGKTGINLTYQAGAQYINSETDRIDLLAPIRTNNRISLGRYQATASLSRGFLLWQGKGLPATPTEGMRYTPAPVVPYLQLIVGTTGVGSGYSNGDTQSSLSGNIGLQGQFGHFSKPFLDYTGFNVTYSQVARTGTSPFLFDRVVDNRVLSGGITQQLYGPFRIGFQTAVNLDTRQQISTDYFLEYSRRTYNVILRYNPILSLGSLSFRINDFNWFGNSQPFDDNVRPVVQGVTR